ncbi:MULTISPECIES: rhomboid family intramembrane serine protease [Flavobacterium]|uniref:Rhomboid family intramembrane serine protease n=1 Tax=Flavobacterium hankyongi TaxID=1176532 RepID=A0ABP9A9J8_9FLAO|nr:rhomboid family intramembrane serine protease [Flavobacterium sp. N1846]
MSLIDDFKSQYKMGDMTTKLIFWNILLFAIPSVLFALLKLFNVPINYYNYVGLSSNLNQLLMKPWTLFSYSFFHSGFFHILFNMIMLNFSGKLFTTFFTQKQLVGLYVLGGVLGGLLYLIAYLFLPFLQNKSGLLVGASASVMAILIATTTYSPYMNLRLALIGNVKLWHIAIVFLVIDLIQLPLENSGGHLAHIGGALFGFIYIKALQSGTDLSSGFNSVLDFFVNLFSSKETTPFKKVHKNPKSSNPTKTTSRVVTKDRAQQQIDEILDKISQSGYDSLTKEEKEFLFKAGK